jgi:cytochrome c
MKKSVLILLILGCINLINANEEGRKLVEEKCSQCHMINSMTKNKKADGKLKAPPMWGVMRKVREHFKTEDEVTAFIRDYTFNPSEKKMIFPKATMEYFGLMPSLKKELTDEQLHIIARYLLKL